MMWGATVIIVIVAFLVGFAIDRVGNRVSTGDNGVAVGRDLNGNLTINPNAPSPKDSGNFPQVGSFTGTGIWVRAGDKVVITANGTMRIGDWLGSSGPDGRTAGVLGLPIDGYNIVPHFSHAVLMCGISGENSWHSCGSNYEFIAPLDGEVLLEINDTVQSNNTGGYRVTVEIYDN